MRNVAEIGGFGKARALRAVFYNSWVTGKQFYDWQTVGGTDDVMRPVDALERADIRWCAIGGVAVDHWAAEPPIEHLSQSIAYTRMNNMDRGRAGRREGETGEVGDTRGLTRTDP